MKKDSDQKVIRSTFGSLLNQLFLILTLIVFSYSVYIGIDMMVAGFRTVVLYLVGSMLINWFSGTVMKERMLAEIAQAKLIKEEEKARLLALKQKKEEEDEL